MSLGFSLSGGICQQNYFPLKIDNQWTYDRIVDNNSSGEYTLTIIDTVIENNTKYYLFDRFFFVRELQDSVLFRIEGLKIMRRVDGVDQVWFDFDAHINDVWTIEVFDNDLNDTVQTEVTLLSKSSRREVNGRTFENCFIFSFTPPATDLYWSYMIAPEVGCVEFIISSLVPDSYHFREGFINDVDYSNLVTVNDQVKGKPYRGFNSRILSVYPNPFNGMVSIQVELKDNSEDESIVVAIYNINSKLVKSLASERKFLGIYEYIWMGDDNNNQLISSGIYFVALKIGNQNISTKKVLFIK